MQWKMNWVLEPICLAILEIDLRNAAELKIAINKFVHFSRQEKHKVIIKLFPITLL